MENHTKALSNLVLRLVEIFENDRLAAESALNGVDGDDFDSGGLSDTKDNALIKARRKRDRQTLRRKTLIEIYAGIEKTLEPTAPQNKLTLPKSLGLETFEEVKERVENALGITFAEFERVAREMDLKEPGIDLLLLGNYAQRLPNLVSFLDQLDETDFRGLPEELKPYFREAHRSFLDGAYVSTLLMCGSIVEAALKTTSTDGPDGEKTRESLRHQAIVAGRLDKIAGDHCKHIFTIRDKAAHSLDELAGRDMHEQASEKLIMTRTVLSQLFHLSEFHKETA